MSEQKPNASSADQPKATEHPSKKAVAKKAAAKKAAAAAKDKATSAAAQAASSARKTAGAAAQAATESASKAAASGVAAGAKALKPLAKPAQAAGAATAASVSGAASAAGAGIDEAAAATRQIMERRLVALGLVGLISTVAFSVWTFSKNDDSTADTTTTSETTDSGATANADGAAEDNDGGLATDATEGLDSNGTENFGTWDGGAGTGTGSGTAGGNLGGTTGAGAAGGNQGGAAGGADTGNPGTGNPGTGNPGTGNPGTGNPGTETEDPAATFAAARASFAEFSTVTAQDFPAEFTAAENSARPATDESPETFLGKLYVVGEGSPELRDAITESGLDIELITGEALTATQASDQEATVLADAKAAVEPCGIPAIDDVEYVPGDGGVLQVKYYFVDAASSTERICVQDAVEELAAQREEDRTVEGQEFWPALELIEDPARPA